MSSCCTTSRRRGERRARGGGGGTRALAASDARVVVPGQFPGACGADGSDLRPHDLGIRQSPRRSATHAVAISRWPSTSRPAASPERTFADQVIESLARRGVPASRPHRRGHRDRAAHRPAACRRPAQHAGRPRYPSEHRRFRLWPDLAQLPVVAAHPRVEDRQELRVRHAGQPRTVRSCARSSTSVTTCRFVSWLRASRPRSCWTSYG